MADKETNGSRGDQQQLCIAQVKVQMLAARVNASVSRQQHLGREPLIPLLHAPPSPYPVSPPPIPPYTPGHHCG
jgi:hypothetical protein